MSVRLTVISSKLVVVRMRWKANYIDVRAWVTFALCANQPLSYFLINS